MAYDIMTPSELWDFFRTLSSSTKLAALANYATSYNVISISLGLKFIEDLYPIPGDTDDSTSWLESSLPPSSLILGMIFGQLLFGYLGDVIAPRRGVLACSLIQVAGAVLSSVLPGHVFNDQNAVYWLLSSTRFFLGVGAGGIYPLAAILAAGSSGSSGSSKSSTSVALVFSMQGVGYLTPPALFCAFLAMSNADSDNEAQEWIWRAVLGGGAIPAAGVGVVCYLMGVDPRQHADEHDGNALDAPMIDPSSPPPSMWTAIKSEPDVVRKLIGTAGTWFLFDILFYGNSIFQPVVIETAFGSDLSLADTSLDALILQLLALPGYFISVATMSRLGPRLIQTQGFFFMAILYTLIGATWDSLKKSTAALLILYGFTFFFANFGPNSTTFLLPALTFSPKCRSTLNGFSAASGKLGALLGSAFFGVLVDEWGDSAVMLICAVIATVSLVITLWSIDADVGKKI